MEGTQSSNTKLIVFGLIGLVGLGGIGLAVWSFWPRDNSGSIESRNGKCYKEFCTSFTSTLAKNESYVYGPKQGGLTGDALKPFTKNKSATEAILCALAYHKLFVESKTGTDGKSTLLAAATEDAIKNFEIDKADVKTVGATFDKILADATVLKELIITSEQIGKVPAMNLSSFKIAALPSGFAPFTSLATIVLDEITELKSLEELNDATKLEDVSAKNCGVVSVKLEKLAKLKRLNLTKNPLTKIDSDFVKNHPDLENGGFVISLKDPNGKFSDEITKLVGESQGKIILEAAAPVPAPQQSPLPPSNPLTP